MTVAYDMMLAIPRLKKSDRAPLNEIWASEDTRLPFIVKLVDLSSRLASGPDTASLDDFDLYMRRLEIFGLWEAVRPEELRMVVVLRPDATAISKFLAGFVPSTDYLPDEKDLEAADATRRAQSDVGRDNFTTLYQSLTTEDESRSDPEGPWWMAGMTTVPFADPMRPRFMDPEWTMIKSLMTPIQTGGLSPEALSVDLQPGYQAGLILDGLEVKPVIFFDRMKSAFGPSAIVAGPQSPLKPTPRREAARKGETLKRDEGRS